MRIAITGANGLLGGAAVLRLIASAHPERSAAEGRAESRGPRGPPPQLLALGRGPSRLPPGPYTWRDTDLGDGRSVEAALREFRPDAVLHAGAATDVDGCERDPALAERVNVGGTEQVARACRDLGARLVAVSTDYVFDGEAGPYAEDAVPIPRGAYARTKLEAERAALALVPDCAVARVAVVYSGRAGAKPTFATQVVEKLSRGEVVKAFSDQLVTTTLAENGAAMVLELLLETDFRGVLHTSDATWVGRVEFAQRVARQFGLAGEIVPVKTADVKLAAPRPLKAGLRVDRAAALLRNQPLALDEALERFHAQWRASHRAVRNDPG